MPLTLVVGRPNAGKTGVLHDLIRRSADVGRPSVVLLPSRTDVHVAIREFALRGPSLGVNVTTIDDYIDDLWALYGDGRTIVGPAERRLFLSRAVRGSQLDALAGSATGDGLARLLSPLATNSFHDVVRPSSGRGVAVEVAEMLSGYEDLLSTSNRVERAGALRGLEMIASAGWFEGPLVANRFADLTPVQERFLVLLSAHADVWLSLPWERGLAATRSLDPLVDRLLAAGATLVELPPGDYTHSEELRYLESHLFLAPSAAIGAPREGDVTLSYAFGAEAEAGRIVAEAQAALAAGVAPSQVAVVFRNAAEHVQLLRSAFAEAGIPAEFDVVRRASGTGWGRALLHLMRFAADRSRADLLGFLRSPYSGETRDAVDEFEARWRRLGIDDDVRLRRSLHDANSAAVTCVDLSSQLMGSPWYQQAAEKWKYLADALLRNAYSTVAANLDPEALLDASAHSGFLRLVSLVDSLSVLHSTSRELLSAYSELEVAANQSSVNADAVKVLSASRARSRRFKVVIVGGLSAGDFPRPERENPLAQPVLAAALSDLGIEVEHKDERDLARLTFYLVASRATERLVLSRQVAASDGSEKRSSWLLEELLDLYRDPRAEEVSEHHLPPISVLGFSDSAECEQAPKTNRRALRTAVLTGTMPTDALSAARVSSATTRGRRREPLIADERVLAQLRQREVFSATEIESYLRCPYSWFRERVVRAQPLEPEADAMELGRICHEVLRRVFSRLCEAGDDRRVTTGNLTAVLELADQMLVEMISAEGEPRSIEQRAVRASARRRVRGLLRADAAFLPGFAPVAHELQFDSDSDLFAGFQLRGRIDRVDRGPDGGLVVIDYKTGQVGAGHSATKFAQNGLVQLALYARVVEANLGAPVVGGLYRRVSSQNVASSQNRGFFIAESAEGPGLVSTDKMDRQQVDAVIDSAEERALEAVSGIRAGCIPAEPLDRKTCQRCAFRTSCGRLGS